MQKGKVPDHLPNKPTLGSGSSENIPQGYFNKNSALGSGINNSGVNLPVLSNPYVNSVA
jgi:hypothetical protein